MVTSLSLTTDPAPPDTLLSRGLSSDLTKVTWVIQYYLATPKENEKEGEACFSKKLFQNHTEQLNIHNLISNSCQSIGSVCSRLVGKSPVQANIKVPYPLTARNSFSLLLILLDRTCSFFPQEVPLILWWWGGHPPSQRRCPSQDPWWLKEDDHWATGARKLWQRDWTVTSLVVYLTPPWPRQQ